MVLTPTGNRVASRRRHEKRWRWTGPIAFGLMALGFLLIFALIARERQGQDLGDFVGVSGFILIGVTGLLSWVFGLVATFDRQSTPICRVLGAVAALVPALALVGIVIFIFAVGAAVTGSGG